MHLNTRPLPLIALFAVGFGLVSAAEPARAFAATASSLPANIEASYVLGNDDQITVRVLQAEEVPDRPFRIDESGNIDLPMIGSVHAAGLTVHDLSRQLVQKFSVYIREPQVNVFLTDMRSQPVSVLGAVNAPGTHQLQGHKTMIEMLALAGGIRQDAGYRAKVTRQARWGLIPLPDARMDLSGQVSVAEIPLKVLLEGTDPAQNISILPDDVITVPVGELVYVMGEVKKPGGFVLGDRPQLTVLQALAMADGVLSAAKKANAQILRAGVAGSANGSVVQIPVDIKKIMEGHAPDVPMQPRDILYVPADGAKRMAQRAVDSLFAIGTGAALLYRP